MVGESIHIKYDDRDPGNQMSELDNDFVDIEITR